MSHANRFEVNTFIMIKIYISRNQRKSIFLISKNNFENSEILSISSLLKQISLVLIILSCS